MWISICRYLLHRDDWLVGESSRMFLRRGREGLAIGRRYLWLQENRRYFHILPCIPLTLANRMLSSWSSCESRNATSCPGPFQYLYSSTQNKNMWGEILSVWLQRSTMILARKCFGGQIQSQFVVVAHKIFSLSYFIICYLKRLVRYWFPSSVKSFIQRDRAQVVLQIYSEMTFTPFVWINWETFIHQRNQQLIRDYKRRFVVLD